MLCHLNIIIPDRMMKLGKCKCKTTETTLPIKNSKIKQTQKNEPQVLEGLWGKGYPYSLLVELQTGVVTLKIRMENPQKANNKHTIYSSCTTTWCMPKVLDLTYLHDTQPHLIHTFIMNFPANLEEIKEAIIA